MAKIEAENANDPDIKKLEREGTTIQAAMSTSQKKALSDVQ
jgi:hypothetical protein